MGEPCRVFLIGMMGSGKTTIGRLVADATGWAYVDNDDLLRQMYGTTGRRILEDGGEERLRESEAAALTLGLRTEPPVLVGAAAGTILDADSRRGLQAAGTVVYLRADAETLEARAMGGEHRAWLDTGGGSWIRRTLKERASLYEATAHVIVDTDRREADDVAREVRSRIAERCDAAR